MNGAKSLPVGVLSRGYGGHLAPALQLWCPCLYKVDQTSDMRQWRQFKLIAISWQLTHSFSQKNMCILFHLQLKWWHCLCWSLKVTANRMKTIKCMFEIYCNGCWVPGGKVCFQVSAISASCDLLWHKISEICRVDVWPWLGVLPCPTLLFNRDGIYCLQQESAAIKLILENTLLKTMRQHKNSKCSHNSHSTLRFSPLLI